MIKSVKRQTCCEVNVSSSTQTESSRRRMKQRGADGRFSGRSSHPTGLTAGNQPDGEEGVCVGGSVLNITH